MAGMERGVGFPITAHDQFSGAFEKLKSQVTGTERAFSKFNGMLATLGIAGAAVGFASMVNQMIGVQAKMKDLAQEAGATASAISMFEAPARLAGSSLESVAGAMFRLGKASIEARDPTTSAAAALKAIGISTQQLKGLKPDEMFELVARQVAGYSDGLEKNAVMQTLFNKSGREMSRVIAEIADKKKLVATVTDEEAEAADRLGDQMVELQMSHESLFRSIAADVVPALNAMLKGFIDGKREAGYYEGAVRALSALFSEINGTGPAAELAKIETRMKELTKDTKTLQEQPWWAMFGQGSIKGAPAMLAELTKRRDALRSEIHAEEMRLQDLRAGSRGKGAPDFDPDAARKALEAQKRLTEERRQLWDEEFKDLQQLEKELKSAYDNMERLSKKLDEQIEKDLDKVLDGIVEDVGDAVDAGVQLSNDLAQPMLRMWDDLGNAAGTFFSDLVMNGKSAFGNLKQMLKSLLADMLAIFAKRWFLNLAAGGSVMGSAGQALAGGVGGDSLAGGIMNWGSTALSASSFGGALWGAAGMGAGGIPAAAGMGLTAAAESIAINAAAGSYGGALAGVQGALAAVPVWGWVALAAIAIAGWFGSQGGGPKTGGSFFSGQGGVPGTDNGRFFTPDQGDDMLREQIEGLQAGYGSLAARLGGSAGDFGFGVGFDHDPHGTAASRVSSMLTAADGSVLYSNLDREMDDKEVPEQIALELKRQLLAALQNTDFDDHIDDIFDSITDIANATAEEIDAILARALEMKSVIEGLTALDAKGLDVDALIAWQREGESLGQAFDRVAGQFAAFNDAFMTEAEKLDAARGFVSSAFVEMGIAIPDSMEAFYDLVHGIDLSTEAGRDLFDALMRVAPAFAQVTNAAAAAFANLQQIIGSIQGPGYTNAVLSSQFEAAVSQFKGNNSWASGLSSAGLVGQLLTITSTDFGNYSSANQALITQILSLHSQMKNLNNTTTTTTGIIGGLGDAAGNATDALSNAKNGIIDWLNQLLLSGNSTLSPQEKFDFARDRYVETLLKAQGGDLNALAEFTSVADAYLQEARSMFASGSQYQSIFAAVTGQAAGLAGLAAANRPYTAADALANTAALIEAIRELQASVGFLQGTVAQTAAAQANATIKAAQTTARATIDAASLTFK